MVLNQHRILRTSDSDTNELSASLGIALSYMSSRIISSLCSSQYSQFNCTIIPCNDDLNLPIRIRTDTLRKVLNKTYDQQGRHLIWMLRIPLQQYALTGKLLGACLQKIQTAIIQEIMA